MVSSLLNFFYSSTLQHGVVAAEYISPIATNPPKPQPTKVIGEFRELTTKFGKHARSLDSYDDLYVSGKYTHIL